MSEIDQIRKILEKHEKRISDLEKLIKSKPVLNPIEGEEAILNLLNSGFFDTAKRYGAVIKELKSQAKFDKKQKYKEILQKLTREEKLERKVRAHQWEYRKK
jgi:hypothetical protein